MQKLSILMLSVSLMSQPTLANENCSLTKARCEDALSSAEKVIRQQDELINVMHKRFMEISDDNMRIQEQIINAEALAQREKNNRYVFGSVALIVGFAAGMVLGGR